MMLIRKGNKMEKYKHWSEKDSDWDSHELDSAMRTVHEYHKIKGNVALMEKLHDHGTTMIKSMKDLKKARDKKLSEVPGKKMKSEPKESEDSDSDD